jgi:hypothetical protein
MYGISLGRMGQCRYTAVQLYLQGYRDSVGHKMSSMGYAMGAALALMGSLVPVVSAQSSLPCLDTDVTFDQVVSVLEEVQQNSMQIVGLMEPLHAAFCGLAGAGYNTSLCTGDYHFAANAPQETSSGSFFVSVSDDFQQQLAAQAVAGAFDDGTLTADEIIDGTMGSDLTSQLQEAICAQLSLDNCDDVDITGINLSGGTGRRRVLVSVDSPAAIALTDDSSDLMVDPQGAAFVHAIKVAICGSQDCESVTVTSAAA